jgi:predicted transcriptional regulator
MMASSDEKGENNSGKQLLADKWPDVVTTDSGFVAVPAALLRLQARLGLSATDLVVLTNLLLHWWEPSRGVYPRTTVIADRMGVTKRTVQRSLEKLIRSRMIERTLQADGKRVFQFSGLVQRLQQEMPRAFNVKLGEAFDT